MLEMPVTITVKCHYMLTLICCLQQMAFILLLLNFKTLKFSNYITKIKSLKIQANI